MVAKVRLEGQPGAPSRAVFWSRRGALLHHETVVMKTRRVQNIRWSASRMGILRSVVLKFLQRIGTVGVLGRYTHHTSCLRNSHSAT